MDKVIELALKSGLMHGNCLDELCEFYTLASADLEAELLEQARIVGMGGERELKLMAENAKLTETIKSLNSALTNTSRGNAKLRKALSPFVLANSSEEHMTLIVRTADITAARAALGENK